MTLSKIVRDSLNTGIDDNSDATAITIDSSERVGIATPATSNARCLLHTHPSGTGSIPTNYLVQQDDNNLGLVIMNTNDSATYSGLRIETRSNQAAGWLVANEFQSAFNGDLVFRARNAGSTSAEILRMKSAGGITFNGDTAAANALNDYETGTWTPTFLASGTNPTVNSVGNGTGYYVKVGDIVHFSYYTSAMNIGSAGSGAAYVGNLPFTSSNGSNEYWLFQYVHGTAIGSSVTGGYINNNQNAITFILPNSTSGVSWTAGSPQYMMIAGSYRAA